MRLASLTHFALLLVLLPAAHAGEADAFFAQDTSAQHLLSRAEDRFRLFRHNMVSTNPGIARFEETTAGDKDGMRLTDDSAEAQGGFYTHFPIQIEPWTSYTLALESHVRKTTGPTPYLEITLLDENRDPLRTLRHDLAVQPGSPIRQHGIPFATPRKGRALVIYLWSTPAGTCDLLLDSVWLEQQSVAGKLRPAGMTLFAVDELTTSAAPCHITLPTTSAVLKLYARVAWQNPRETHQLQLEWLDETGAQLVRDVAQLRPVVGIQPQWNGLEIEWLRTFAVGSRTFSCALERFTNSGPVSGTADLDREIEIPSQARAVRMTQPNPIGSGIAISRVKLTLEPDPVP